MQSILDQVVGKARPDGIRGPHLIYETSQGITAQRSFKPLKNGRQPKPVDPSGKKEKQKKAG